MEIAELSQTVENNTMRTSGARLAYGCRRSAFHRSALRTLNSNRPRNPLGRRAPLHALRDRPDPVPTQEHSDLCHRRKSPPPLWPQRPTFSGATAGARALATSQGKSISERSKPGTRLQSISGPSRLLVAKSMEERARRRGADDIAPVNQLDPAFNASRGRRVQLSANRREAIAVIDRRVRHLDVLERLLDGPGRERVLVLRKVRQGPGSEENLV
jgi:hypothetical protein